MENAALVRRSVVRDEGLRRSCACWCFSIPCGEPGSQGEVFHGHPRPGETRARAVEDREVLHASLPEECARSHGVLHVVVDGLSTGGGVSSGEPTGPINIGVVALEVHLELGGSQLAKVLGIKELGPVSQLVRAGRAGPWKGPGRGLRQVGPRGAARGLFHETDLGVHAHLGRGWRGSELGSGGVRNERPGASPGTRR